MAGGKTEGWVTSGVRPRLTRGAAIREFCTECMGFQVRYIKECPAEACPLWPFRNGTEEKTSVLLHRQTSREVEE